MSEPITSASRAVRPPAFWLWLPKVIASGWILPTLLSAIPFGVLVVLIRRYYVDVPVWDQWELVPLLQKSYAGSLSFGDLWAQHNEHRLFFPQIIMVGLARISSWSVGYELALNVVLAVGVLAVLAFQLRAVMKAFSFHTYVLFLLPVIALQTFSLQQYENWLWGWQIQIFLNVFAAVAGLALLARPYIRWKHFILACLCGIVAFYSFANGIVYWPVGGILLLVAHPMPTRQIRLARWVWLAVACAAIGFYLAGYRSPSGQAPWLIVIDQPLAYFRYVVTYLGAPVFSFDQIWASYAGLVSLGVFGCLAWSAYRLPPATRRPLLPLFALGLYAIGSAVITGLGRATIGNEQALSSRYVTLSSFLVLVDILLLVFTRRFPLVPRWFGTWVAPSAAAGLLVLVVLSSVQALTRFSDRHAYLLPARAALLSSSNDELLSRLYPDPAIVRQRRAFLQTQHLSVFRDAKP